MPRSVYLDEAAYLATSIPKNRCPSTDALDVLDTHPHIRLALEDTWTDPGGRVYREVPADRLSRWPAHLAKRFGTFLRISRNPEQVFRLLDLLHSLDAGDELIRATLAACRKRKSLDRAVDYFEGLATELDSVTCARPDRVRTLGGRDIRCTLRRRHGDVEIQSWSIANDKEDDDDLQPATHRPELLHDPNKQDDGLTWIHDQPRPYRRLYWRLHSTRPDALDKARQEILDASDGRWSHSQVTVLWETYRARRDCMREQQTRRAKATLKTTARKLLRRISRIESRPDLGHVGKCLYEAMKGSLPLPGPVSRPEWAVVFDAYRTRKAELLATTD